MREVPPPPFCFPLFLIGGQLLYNIVWVSAIHQHESAMLWELVAKHLPAHHTPCTFRLWQRVACPLLALYRVTPHFLSEERRSGEIFNRSVQQKSVMVAYWNIHSFVRISEISHISGCSERHTLAESQAVILRAFVLRDHPQIVTTHFDQL